MKTKSNLLLLQQFLIKMMQRRKTTWKMITNFFYNTIGSKQFWRELQISTKVRTGTDRISCIGSNISKSLRFLQGKKWAATETPRIVLENPVAIQ
jgi:hypothetical protein